jgi:hypothetical protein
MIFVLDLYRGKIYISTALVAELTATGQSFRVRGHEPQALPPRPHLSCSLSAGSWGSLPLPGAHIWRCRRLC